jgi:hypothetical protein
MKYNFVHKKPGIKDPELILQLNTSSPIEDFCCVDNGFFIVEQQKAYLVGLDGRIIKEIKIAENQIQGVCSFNNTIYLLADGEVFSPFINKYYLSKSERADFRNLFNNIKNPKAKLHVDNNNIYISVENLNRCFIIKDLKVCYTIGKGDRNYSLSDDILKSSLSIPKGISFYKNELIFSDYGNGCLRGFRSVHHNPSHRIIVGDPKKRNIKMEKLFIINNILYYNNESTVYLLSMSTTNIVINYQNPKLRNISLSTDNKIISLIEE